MRESLDPMVDPRVLVTPSLNSALKHLLEVKHLYQSEELDPSAVAATIAGGTPPAQVTEAIREALLFPWRPSNPEAEAKAPVVEARVLGQSLKLHVPTIHVVCARCQSPQPFNLIRASTLAVSSGADQPSGLRSVPIVQTFCFIYQCQLCKGTEDAFLVRREHLKLVLCGRSPIELVRVPPEIPKHVAGFWRDALVAYDSGRALAGLFFLRVLIEQFCYAFLRESTMNADEAVEAYMKTLDPAFSSKFPSLRAAYSDLSGAIHAARADEKLFETWLGGIREHFDARRVHKLGDFATQSPSKE